jgi:DNA invertase Pin-like site-specific DNA recombinase
MDDDVRVNGGLRFGDGTLEGFEVSNKLVGLVRVSTGKQGESRLGLEAQEAAIEAYRQQTASTLLKTYVEVESGTHDDIQDRPQLRAAVAHAKRAGAVLTIAKIDRMVRSTVVMAYLKTSKVRFIACDNPYANELTIDILVAVAADEARRISTRTKDALAAYKAGRRVSKRVRSLYPEGVPSEVVDALAGKLGASLPQCRNLTPEARTKGVARSVAARKMQAVDAYADLAPFMRELHDGGHTLQGIADRLNSEGHTTRRGKAWSPTQVWRVLERIDNQTRL